VRHKSNQPETDEDGARPILAIRVPPDIKKTFDALSRLTNRKFQQSHFVNEAIIEKLEKEFTPELLRKCGYVYLEGRKNS
jgi:hypothetical protein